MMYITLPDNRLWSPAIIRERVDYLSIRKVGKKELERIIVLTLLSTRTPSEPLP